MSQRRPCKVPKNVGPRPAARYAAVGPAGGHTPVSAPSGAGRSRPARIRSEGSSTQRWVVRQLAAAGLEGGHTPVHAPSESGRSRLARARSGGSDKQS